MARRAGQQRAPRLVRQFAKDVGATVRVEARQDGWGAVHWHDRGLAAETVLTVAPFC